MHALILAVTVTQVTIFWREDSGLLTDKTKLPVKQLYFGDLDEISNQEGYRTLGKLKCYGMA